MDQKKIGIILLILGLIVVTMVFIEKLRDDAYLNNIIEDIGSCYLADGTCLHDERDFITYYIPYLVIIIKKLKSENK